jgi:hypothetical protein
MADWNASIDQTLPSISSVLTGEIFNPDDRAGVIVQTLPAITISAMTGRWLPGTVLGSIDQTLPSLSSVLRGIGTTPTIDFVEVTDAVTHFATVIEPLQTDTVEVSDLAIDGVIDKISESVVVSDSSTALNTAIEIISDPVIVKDDGLSPIWLDSISDPVEVSDSVTQATTEFITDTVEATDSAPSYLWLEVISDKVEVSDNAPVLWLDSISDEVLVSDQVLGELRIVLEIISDAVEVIDSVLSAAGVIDRIVDIVLASDTAQSAPSIIHSAVTDTVIVRDFSYAADPDSLAWVLNTETGAPWLFTNYNFHSVIEHAGMLLGGAEDGLYFLQGENDAGIDIDAEVITGMLDFGFPNKKRVPYLYFGYTGGELECDVESYDQPDDIYTYGMEPRDAEAPRNNRIKLGKGLNSRYWRFTIRNVAGAAFQVYDKLADVVASKRRL